MFRAIRITAGPRMTMNIDGKMQPTSGNSILIGALAAAGVRRGDYVRLESLSS